VHPTAIPVTQKTQLSQRDRATLKVG